MLVIAPTAWLPWLQSAIQATHRHQHCKFERERQNDHHLLSSHCQWRHGTAHSSRVCLWPAGPLQHQSDASLFPCCTQTPPSSVWSPLHVLLVWRLDESWLRWFYVIHWFHCTMDGASMVFTKRWISWNRLELCKSGHRELQKSIPLHQTHYVSKNQLQIGLLSCHCGGGGGGVGWVMWQIMSSIPKWHDR